MANTTIMDMPAAIAVDGSEYFPIVQTGTNKRVATGLIMLANASGSVQNANTVFAGPTTGAAASPSFRALVAADFTGTVWPVTQGGSGLSSLTAYALMAGGTTSTGAMQQVSGVGTAGQVLVSAGAGALPAWQNSSAVTGEALTRTNDTNVTLTLGGTPATALLAATSLTLGWTGTLAAARGGTGVSSLGTISKTDDTNVTLTLGGTPANSTIQSVAFTLGWTGQLAVARGGTGQATAAAAFDALAPTTTRGDLIYRNATTNTRLAASTSGYHLQTNGASTDPTWAAFVGAGTGGASRTWQSKAADFVFAEDYGAVGDGTTNDTTALINAMTAGGVVALKGGLTYRINSQVAFPANDCGLVCYDGVATILMGTGAGQFDSATYLSTFTNIGLYAIGRSGVFIQNIKVQMETNASIRTCSPIAIRNSSKVLISNVEITAFKEMEFPAINLDSVTVAEIEDVYIHDITTNSATLPTMQLTGIGLDYNRISSVNSTLIRITTPVIKDISLGAAATTAYGDQTDGINVQSQAGGSGEIISPMISTVGEGIDIFAQNWTVTGGYIANVLAYGIKFVHGARYNRVTGTIINSTGRAAVVWAGSNSASQDCSQNWVSDLTIVGVGDQTASGGSVVKAAFATDGSSATHKPNRNGASNCRIINLGNMDWVFANDAGDGNICGPMDIYGAVANFQTAYSRTTSGSLTVMEHLNGDPQSIASAGTCNIGELQTSRVVITDAVPITSFGTAPQRFKWVSFTGAPLLTHNATTLILPGGANITAAAGDTALFSSDTSGNWRCLSYQRASGIPIDVRLAAIAALAVTDNNVIVGNGSTWIAESGNTARTSLGVGSGDSPQFTAVNLSDATANTLTGSAGDAFIEGNLLYRAGGTDVPVTDGGTGRSTGTTAYALVATGTTATGAQQTLASGATTEILVGGGAAALPVWTTATGSGAPVRATSPTIAAPTLTGTSTTGRIIASDQISGVTVFEVERAADSPAFQILRTDAHGSGANIGYLRFYGRDSGAAQELYAVIGGFCLDNTATSEDGEIRFQAITAGTLGEIARFNNAGPTYINAVAVPAGGTTGTGIKMSSTANLGLFFGSGAPSLSAAQGSLYMRTDGSSTSTRLYVNTNGTTGWTNVTTAA